MRLGESQWEGWDEEPEGSGEEVKGELGSNGQTKRFVVLSFLSDELPGSVVRTHEEENTLRIQPDQIQTIPQSWTIEGACVICTE